VPLLRRTIESGRPMVGADQLSVSAEKLAELSRSNSVAMKLRDSKCDLISVFVKAFSSAILVHSSI